MASTVSVDFETILEESTEDMFDEVPSTSTSSSSTSTVASSTLTVTGVSLGILDEACKELEADECIPRDVIAKINNAEKQALVSSLQFLDRCLIPKRKFKHAVKEQVWRNFHGAFLSNKGELGKLLTPEAAVWLSMKVVELLISANYDQPLNRVCDVPNEERDIVAYIGGFVVHALMKRARRIYDIEERSTMIKYLQQLSSNDPIDEPGSSSSSSMTQLLDRGGLVKIHPNMFQLFLELETIFRSCFGGQQQHIHIEHFSAACEQSELITTCLFDQLYGAPEYVMEKIVQGIMKCYFTVRVHHKCKTYMDSHRQKTMSIKKQKGLRKKLSQTSVK